MNNTPRKLIIAATAILLGISASARSTSATINTEGASGFNALTHVLQKPLGNDTFPSHQKGFGKNIFMAGSIGTNIIGNDFSKNGLLPGLRFGGQIGSWFSPNYGIRLSVDLGILSHHRPNTRIWFGAVKADWLINLTSINGGYDPCRKFELIGAIGLEYQKIRQKGRWGNEYGVGAALQCRFNVSPSLFLFVEPRLAITSGYRYDPTHDWRRMRADLGLNLGVGYRIISGNERKKYSSVFSQKDDDNLYFGVSGGMFDMMRNSFPNQFFNHHNPYATAHVGKYLSSTSALQFSLGFGRFSTPKAQNRYLSTASLDYVLNLANAFGGYNPNQVFQVLLNAGASLGYVRGTIYPGIDAGITGMFRLDPNWGIYIQPQMHLFTRGFSRSIGARHAPLASVSLGLRYTIGDFSRRHPKSDEAYNDDPKHWFIQMGLGGGARLRGSYTSGAPGFAISFGKRFTPVSSWRLSLDGICYMKTPISPALTVHADYLSDITTAMLGYDPERLFDFQIALGAFAGIANYEGPIAATYGLKGGFQAAFRLSSALQLFIEPTFHAVNSPGARNGRLWIPEVRGLIGLKYNLGTPSGKRGSLANAPFGGERCNFVSISGGPSVFSGSFSKTNMNVTGALDISLGRWFSMVSGLRLTYGNDWIHRIGKINYVGSARIDYLLNLTSLFERSDSRRFHIIGAVGAGLAFCKQSASDFGPMTYGGLQFRFNLNNNIDLHLEPGAEFWANRVIPRPTSPHRFVMTTRLVAGLSYRF